MEEEMSLNLGWLPAFLPEEFATSAIVQSTYLRIRISGFRIKHPLSCITKGVMVNGY
jgi:hypothetical protein